MKEQPALDLTGRRRTSGVVVTVEDLKELLTGEQAIITVSCLMKDIKRARNALQRQGSSTSNHDRDGSRPFTRSFL